MTSDEQRAIFDQWDALARVRNEQISSGTDITYRHFILPHMEELLGNASGMSILDAGCGVGFFTRRLKTLGANVVGIDPSPTSIALAIEADPAGCYEVQTLYSYAQDNDARHDIIVANMVLMNLFDLTGFLAAARKCLTQQGKIVFSVTHPWFWPTYAGYASMDWFEYEKAIQIEKPFTISRQTDTKLLSTHIHRPLNHYLLAFRKGGFLIEALKEPMPTREVENLYENKWRFPRYLFGTLVAQSS